MRPLIASTSRHRILTASSSHCDAISLPCTRDASVRHSLSPYNNKSRTCSHFDSCSAISFSHAPRSHILQCRITARGHSRCTRSSLTARGRAALVSSTPCSSHGGRRQDSLAHGLQNLILQPTQISCIPLAAPVAPKAPVATAVTHSSLTPLTPPVALRAPVGMAVVGILLVASASHR